MITLVQGRHHEVLFGGGAYSWAVGTEVHLPPKLSFFSDFGHFILKVLESAKFAYA